ncbi:MAG: hypothetical protein N2560_10185 [Ignavibacteria bacterium]|nr:hypothetical protein [Ignavibacteria bacterium]
MERQSSSCVCFQLISALLVVAFGVARRWRLERFGVCQFDKNKLAVVHNNFLRR